ncbi:hypothetical protein [Methylobacterium oxalidis]|uniref:Uncharacterized protein n=1 Tax=Methylobacterium oxalidis TaxID=944322 RepID=A0A512J494_9HYPH|nr:hypothetical protein [Methylobacterium oxalidis]GEP04817.1 hypothetical protein MOX02_28550 [Methylobacterium oxalidis]GJE30515.1 hypothetical protein LDDCCGHA_0683 [Methylobacterium oxalidis]GLS63643.1 hypothetical protein GCM10007888_20240 [Methylobacterium oxalidis]
MGTVHPFPPRKPAAEIDVRTAIEDAAQAALDTADCLIALLDDMDGDTDREDGGDAEPSLGAPEGHTSQIAWLRGSDTDGELDQPLETRS